MGGAWTRIFPPKPTFTEINLTSLAGKVYIITGGNSGIGLALSQILYEKGATVWILGRSASKISASINAIKATYPSSSGKLKSAHLDLSDLSTVAPCAEAFLKEESRLDVLWNNAGIGHVPPNSVSKQGYEACMGTNCLGPFLLTKLLLPILSRTAQISPEASVRVIFTSSSIVDLNAPPGGVDIANMQHTDKAVNYSASKAGNWLLASEFGRKVGKDEGVVFITQNPGNLKTNGWNGVPVLKILLSPIIHETRFGALTMLWCGLSPEVKLEGMCPPFPSDYNYWVWLFSWGKSVYTPRLYIHSFYSLHHDYENGTIS
jgi:NAD(P)-dependent dehydrogenase (short-subunit alcohol dehydrogenase family)